MSFSGKMFGEPVRSFLCPVSGCESKFSRNHNLKMHLLTHHRDLNPEKNYESFFLRKKSQTDNKAYRCPYPGCYRAYSMRNNCASHYKQKHMPDYKPRSVHRKQKPCEPEEAEDSLTTATSAPPSTVSSPSSPGTVSTAIPMPIYPTIRPQSSPPAQEIQYMQNYQMQNPSAGVVRFPAAVALERPRVSTDFGFVPNHQQLLTLHSRPLCPTPLQYHLSNPIDSVLPYEVPRSSFTEPSSPGDLGMRSSSSFSSFSLCTPQPECPIPLSSLGPTKMDLKYLLS